MHSSVKQKNLSLVDLKSLATKLTSFISSLCILHPNSSMAKSRAHPLLLLLISLFFLPSYRATSVSYCDKKGNYLVKVKGVEISPDPVVSGQPATFKILGSSSNDISGGKVVIKVSYYGIHVRTETHDLCEETSCPVSTGSFVLSHSQTLPSFTPPGSYKLTMTMNDQNDKQLTCISFGFKISLRAAISAS